jgi:hypothetical protein
MMPVINLINSDLEYADNIYRSYQINPQNTICLIPKGSS